MPRRDPPSPRRGYPFLRFAGVWAVLFALYVLFVGSLSLNEAIVGTASAALACLWWAKAGRVGGKQVDGWASALRPLGGALVALPGATMTVARQLVTVVLSGGPDGAVAHKSPKDAPWAHADAPAERAYGLIAASLSPDAYIVREDEGDGGLLDHALARGGSAP